MHAMIMQSNHLRMQEIRLKTDHAKVHFNEQGTPVADDFGDVYFSNDSGIDETMHVFMAGNALPARWEDHDQAHFVIAETGFGTGLNCLVAMQAFAEFRRDNPQHPLKRLFIITTEKFPLQQEDLATALAHFPQLAAPAISLLSHYPAALQGCHRLDLSAFHTTLDIWMGDIHTTLPQWHAPVTGLVDAWFLDGFAPSKNPDMWTAALFSQMARLSKNTTTVATFTAAGVVKRGLLEQGFEISKTKGFGRKRDMLTAVYKQDKAADAMRFARDWPYYRYGGQPVRAGDHVGIIGAGLAAVNCALALTKRGVRVTLLTRGETLADGASGNRQGGFYPQLHAQANPASLIQAHGFMYAARVYHEVARQQDFDHSWCGVLQLDFTEQQAIRHEKLMDKSAWPSTLVRHVEADAASKLAGVPLICGGLFIATGGWISPASLVRAMVTQAQQSGLLTVIGNREITRITNGAPACVYAEKHDEFFEFDHIIMATGAESINTMLNAYLPLRPVRGQVEAIPQQDTRLSQLKTVLCHKGYMTPLSHGRQALGSTYVKQDMSTQVRASETQQNIATHRAALADHDWIHQFDTDGQARAAVRLGLPDHQVACGALPATLAQQPQWRELAKGKPLSVMPLAEPQSVHMLVGLGSRGLTTAPLMAETLVSQLCEEPLPLPEKLLQAISPQRFLVRQCIRNQLDD